MRSARGFTLVELILALSLGTVIVLLMFRAFTVAATAHEEAQVLIRGQQHARLTLQWVSEAIRASSAVRGGTATAIELAGIFDDGTTVECRGFLLGRETRLRTVILYERRRPSCPEEATSAGGPLTIVSDPAVAVAVLHFRYMNYIGRQITTPIQARLVEVVVGVDADRDGTTDVRLAHVAGLRPR